MKIQRYSAADMREALQIVRVELGADAVILETTETDTGIDVSAAIDYDAETVAQFRPKTPAEAAAGRRQDAVLAGSPAPGQGPESNSSLGGFDDGAAARMLRMQAEVQSIRHLMETHMARLGWNETSRGDPMAAKMMRNLSSLGLAPDVVRQLVNELGATESIDNSWTAPLQLLMKRIPVYEEDLICKGGVFAVVGPTGIGKTTTIAKLAARFALRRCAQDLALVSMDNFRVGAREQLETFGQILGIPVYAVSSGRGLEDILGALGSKKLVLIDTVGMGQRDPRLPEQFARLRSTSAELKVLLGLPANIQHDNMQAIIDAYSTVGPTACVLTKIDEVSSLGSAISVLIRSGIPLAYVADGQRVPEDLHFAKPRQTWLVEFMCEQRVGVTEAYMADNFFGVTADAHV